jgi:hypothetical protein
MKTEIVYSCKIYCLIAFCLFIGFPDTLKGQGRPIREENQFLRIFPDKGKWLASIPKNILGTDLLIESRLAKTPAESSEFSGDEINQGIIRFCYAKDGRVGIERPSYANISKDSTSNGLYSALSRSNLLPLIAVLDSLPQPLGASGVLLDFSNLLNGDNDLFFFALSKRPAGGNMLTDRSYIESIHSYPSHVVVHTVKTYSSGDRFFTYEITTTIRPLPRVPMHMRAFDPRVGYASMDYMDFDVNPQGNKKTSFVTRWRLEPKEEDKAKYLRGELVEPTQPIVFYIDPATPKKWVPYLIRGIEDWEPAFEQAGFKNAISARLGPLNDSSFDIQDAAYNVLVYKAGPGNVRNAIGTSIRDPRSGEILAAHIDWYHDVQQLFHDWYFAQASAIYPPARKMVFDDSLMGRIMRYVASHETGHCLGLEHNWGASSTVPTDSLRNKAWVEVNGICPSIMDYARFNYLAQPEDNISGAGLFPRIGDYDKWAIEWGYRWWTEESTEKEIERLNRWVIDRLAANKKLLFVPGIIPQLQWKGDNDPRSQMEDLGDDAIKASSWGIRNLQRVMLHLVQWTSSPSKDYSDLKSMAELVWNYYGIYLGHVAKHIGGILSTPRTGAENGPVTVYADKQEQKTAVEFLQTQLFITPKWIMDTQIEQLTDVPAIDKLGDLQEKMLGRLLDNELFTRLLQAEAFDPGRTYTIDALLDDLEKGIWSELHKHEPIDRYRRNLQKIYLGDLLYLVTTGPAPKKIPGLRYMGPAGAAINNDVLSILKAHTRVLADRIRSALPQIQDPPSRIHLQDLLERIEGALKS